MLVKNLVYVAVTGLVLTAAGGLTPAAAQQRNSVASDSLFILKTGSAGLLQVKLGKLAEKKGSSPAVVGFGKRMVAQYSKINDELKTAAKNAAFPAPVLIREDQQTFERFNRMGRSSFDKAYMSQMVKQQSEEQRLLEDQSAGGRVQSLKQLAARMLPELQQRLTVARETAGSVGVDVTASTSQARQASTTY